MSPDAWTFTVRRSDVSVPVHSRLIVNTAEAAIDAAMAGVGITPVLSYQIASATRAGCRSAAKPLALTGTPMARARGCRLNCCSTM
jgi:DNA-binding transcriptional LysR family regulator